MSDSRHLAGRWTPDEVIRIIAEAERAGVTHLRLDVASAGITLDLTRDASGTLSDTPDALVSAEADANAHADHTLTITAPLLGTFYRRRTPEEPLIVETGQSVDAGDLLGLIEVMKTYHEITATAAGTVIEFLAEDGHYVEYGQPLAVIRQRH
jgi:acetyl-CoA carboxylase biotin carboxyl carrier protein